jgi:hypothetical protein
MAEFKVDSENKEMFEVFCRIHPHEAFDLNPDAFCDYMHAEGYVLTKEQIKELLLSTNSDSL